MNPKLNPDVLAAAEKLNAILLENDRLMIESISSNKPPTPKRTADVKRLQKEGLAAVKELAKAFGFDIED